TRSVPSGSPGFAFATGSTRSIVNTRPSATVTPAYPPPTGCFHTVLSPIAGHLSGRAGAFQVPSPRTPRHRGQSSEATGGVGSAGKRRARRVSPSPLEGEVAERCAASEAGGG